MLIATAGCLVREVWRKLQGDVMATQFLKVSYEKMPIHKISVLSERWRGFVYEELPGGGWIGRPRSNPPCIHWYHINGPLLVFRNGELHWLSLWERLRCWLKLDDAESLEKKLRPDLM